MEPEILSGREYTKASDVTVYSLGTIIRYHYKRNHYLALDKQECLVRTQLLMKFWKDLEVMSIKDE